jgi:hypothetical protein
VQGQVWASQDRGGEARQAFDEAIAIFDAQGTRLELARALVRRGLLRQAQGEADATRADRSRALALFEACGAGPEAAGTRARLAALSPAP